MKRNEDKTLLKNRKSTNGIGMELKNPHCIEDFSGWYKELCNLNEEATCMILK